MNNAHILDNTKTLQNYNSCQQMDYPQEFVVEEIILYLVEPHPLVEAPIVLQNAYSKMHNYS